MICTDMNIKYTPVFTAMAFTGVVLFSPRFLYKHAHNTHTKLHLRIVLKKKMLNAKQVQDDEALQRRLSVRLVNSKVTHVTVGNNQSTARKRYYTLKIPRCTDTLVKARDFFFSVTHNDGTYSKHMGHVHNKSTPLKRNKKERYNTRETEQKYPLALAYILDRRMRMNFFFLLITVLFNSPQFSSPQTQHTSRSSKLKPIEI